MRNTSLKSFETDRELKAYIYQQLVDIQPFLVTDSQVAVTVSQVARPVKEESYREGPKKRARRLPRDFVVTLSAMVEDGRIEAEGQDANIYDAFGKAKSEMLAQLNEYQNAVVDSSERDAQIQTFIQGNYLLH